VKEFIPRRDAALKEDEKVLATLLAIKDTVAERADIYIPQYVGRFLQTVDHRR
jgi:hypothetical protein